MRFPKWPSYLLLCNKSHQNCVAYFKPVIQFGHESVGLWVGLIENGCLLNAASAGVAC